MSISGTDRSHRLVLHISLVDAAKMLLQHDPEAVRLD